MKRQAIIRKTPDKEEWCVYSKDGKKNLGCDDSKEGAEKRLREVEFFKHKGNQKVAEEYPDSINTEVMRLHAQDKDRWEIAFATVTDARVVDAIIRAESKKAQKEYREGDIVETLRNVYGRTMDDCAFKGDQFTVEFDIPSMNAVSARPIPYSFMPVIVLKKWDIQKVGQVNKERYLNTFSDQELWDAKQVMEEIGEEYSSPEIYEDIINEINQRFEEA